MGIETKKIYKINIKELDDEDKKYIVRLIMEINIFEEKEKMYLRKIEELKEMLEKETKMRMYYRELLHRKEKKMVEIKENQYGNLDIKINDKEYLDVPYSKPKDIVVASSGKGYTEGQYYVRLCFEWTSEEIEYEEIYDEYREEEFRFDDTETLFSFLNIYLNRFKWMND